MEEIRDNSIDNDTEDHSYYFYMKKFGSFFTNDPDWAIKECETEMYNSWLLREREKLKQQISTLTEEQAMIFRFVKGEWWDPKQPRPPQRILMEIIGDAGNSHFQIISPVPKLCILGTGKTYLSECIYKDALLNQLLVVLSTASTGAAAQRQEMATSTLFKYCHMSCSGKIHSSQEQFNRFMRTQLLMIDEHGYTPNRIFSSFAQGMQNVYHQKFPKGKIPTLGDISLLLFGDHLQLPPVKCGSSGGLITSSNAYNDPEWYPLHL